MVELAAPSATVPAKENDSGAEAAAGGEEGSKT